MQCCAAKAPDGEVYVGIRPEGFVPDENGALRCEFRSLEVMGRDVSVVSAHPQAMSATHSRHCRVRQRCSA